MKKETVKSFFNDDRTRRKLIYSGGQRNKSFSTYSKEELEEAINKSKSK